MRPLLVYLDSSDFSDLSNPEADQLNTELLQQLRVLKQDGKILCVYSGIHLSEMAPLDARSEGAAVRRAELLAELCEGNALISVDRVFGREIAHAFGKRLDVPDILSPTGEWFPEGIEDISPVKSAELTSLVHETISELPNRATRRAAKRRMLKNGSVRSAMQNSMANSISIDSIQEVIAKYPMRPEDAAILIRYSMGRGSATDASKAFRASLLDPCWMMKWFNQNRDKLNPIVDWVRAPGRQLEETISRFSTHFGEILELDKRHDTTLANELFTTSKMIKMERTMLENVFKHLASEQCGHAQEQLRFAQIDRHCPGLSVGVRTMFAAMRAAVSITPREPKASDFPDALHAVYAPYVDVFRADSFMAPHIAKNVAGYTRITRVVGKRRDLLRAIRAAIDASK